MAAIFPSLIATVPSYQGLPLPSIMWALIMARSYCVGIGPCVKDVEEKKKTLAAKENVFYADANSTKVTERTVIKQPGYGPALGGSLGGVALQYLCSR